MSEKGGTEYQICNTLATGGTAVLYKAIQTSLDRPVVVKKLHAHLISDPNFTRRFELEAKSAASLDHENIVRIIDFGSAEGSYYIVMEYIDGPSLKDILASRRIIGEELTLLIAHEICMGLDHAHQHGIIHRDIKPANIMITREGQVKITDFGLAKLHQSQTQETVASTLLGTPLYMSPEQAIGNSIDGRSDLFSLGTICYEAMTGTQPFLGDNYAVVIQNIINGSVPPPSRIRKDVSPAAEAIVMKALHREPGKRFRSALEMACAIESILGQDTILSAHERLKRLACGEEDVASCAAHPAGSLPRRRRLPRFAIAAAGVAVAVAVIALNPRGVSNIVNTFRAIHESHPVPPPGEPLVAGHGEALPGISMANLEEPPQAAAAASDTGLVFEKSTQHLTLPNAEEMRKAEMEKAKLVKEPELPAAKNAGPAAQAPATGFIDVAVDPPGEISIDGHQRLYGEHLLMLELPVGAHELVCRREGHRNYVESVQIKRGELSRRRITLEEITGTLLLETPPGAQVFVDGVFKGTTPFSAPLALPAGTHRVDIKKAGFNAWTNAVFVPQDETVRLAISLVPISVSQ